jgi:hypothetical protein
LIVLQINRRPPEMAGEAIRLSPLFTILSEDAQKQIIQGPYGVGARSKNQFAHGSWKCSNCGSMAAWNGARCVICGQMDDD